MPSRSPQPPQTPSGGRSLEGRGANRDAQGRGAPPVTPVPGPCTPARSPPPPRRGSPRPPTPYLGAPCRAAGCRAGSGGCPQGRAAPHSWGGDRCSSVSGSARPPRTQHRRGTRTPRPPTRRALGGEGGGQRGGRGGGQPLPTHPCCPVAQPQDPLASPCPPPWDPQAPHHRGPRPARAQWGSRPLGGVAARGGSGYLGRRGGSRRGCRGGGGRSPPRAGPPAAAPAGAG